MRAQLSSRCPSDSPNLSNLGREMMIFVSFRARNHNVLSRKRVFFAYGQCLRWIVTLYRKWSPMNPTLIFPLRNPYFLLGQPVAMYQSISSLLTTSNDLYTPTCTQICALRRAGGAPKGVQYRSYIGHIWAIHKLYISHVQPTVQATDGPK